MGRDEQVPYGVRRGAGEPVHVHCSRQGWGGPNAKVENLCLSMAEAHEARAVRGGDKAVVFIPIDQTENPAVVP